MAWFRDKEWRDCVLAFEYWFLEATTYVNDYGDHRPRGFYSLTIELVDALIDVAKLDPMPVWDVYRFIRDRLEPGPYTNIVSIEEIEDRLQQVQMLFDRVNRYGVLAEKPGPGAIEVSSTNESRDAWMYEQKAAGLTHGQIAADLARLHPDWEAVENEQSVGKAIDRYCVRNNKPPIRRKRGKTPDGS